MAECFVGGGKATEILDGSGFTTNSSSILLPTGVTWGDIDKMLLVFTYKFMTTRSTLMIRKYGQYVDQVSFDSSGVEEHYRWQHYDSGSETNIDTVMADSDTAIPLPMGVSPDAFLTESIIIKK